MCDAPTNSTSDSVNIAQFGFHFLLGFSTILLDISIIYAVYFTRPRINNSFYVVFSIYAVMQVATFLVDYIFFRAIAYLTFLRCPILTSYGWPTYSYKFTVFYVGTYYFNFAQGICFMFITVNRLTAVLFPSKHKKIWAVMLPFVLASCLLLPLLFSFQTISPTSFTESFSGLTMIYQRWIPWLRISFTSSIVQVIYAVISILCTVATVLLLIHLPTRVKSLERKLCTVGIVMSVTYALQTALSIWMYYTPTDLNSDLQDYLQEIKTYVTDLAFVPGPWSLFFMSAEIRNRLKRMWGWKAVAESPTERTSRGTDVTQVQ